MILGARLSTPTTAVKRIVMPDGQIQMSFTFGPQSEHRMVAGVQAKYDGEELKVKQVGPPLKTPARPRPVGAECREFCRQVLDDHASRKRARLCERQ